MSSTPPNQQLAIPQSDPKKVTKRQIKKHVDELDLPDKAKLKAIAIKYDVKKDRAPRIVATGKASVAEEILRIAEENQVPFYEDKTLAEMLSKLEFDSEVPAELYAIIAEVLAFVYQLDKLAKKKNEIKRKQKETRK
jgi:flagellar biosynthesis protein